MQVTFWKAFEKLTVDSKRQALLDMLMFGSVCISLSGDGEVKLAPPDGVEYTKAADGLVLTLHARDIEATS